MVISRLLKSQIIAKYDELVKQLQAEARMLFYDHMMYDINDSLTSILAVCEVEPKEAIPKIKQYIHRINQSLNITKNYQNNSYAEKRFNVSLVSKNIIRVIKENYKDIKLVSLISDIKAPVLGDQSKFEQLLLYIFVGMFFQGNTSDSEILIELRQKDQNAMFTVLKDTFSFSKEILGQIDKIREETDFKGNVQITPQGKGVEVIIKIPLQFGLVTIGKPMLKKTTAGLKPASSKKEKVATQEEPSAIRSNSAEKGIGALGFAF